MSAPDTSFQATNYQFDPSNMQNMAFESNSDQQNLEDSPIMWGGMQQLALNQNMSQKWPQGVEQYMFDQPAPVTHIDQYGQITPPNDDSPFPPALRQDEDLASRMAFGPGQPQEDPPAASTRSKRSGTSRKARDKQEGAERAPEKQKKTTRKARKGYKAMTKEEEENDSEGEMKRERFLERNRVAASKCRQKKKEWTNGLEAHARDLAAANAQLNGCVLSLKEEVLYLKSECLKHTECDCSRIREYLDHSIAGMNLSGSLGMMPHDQAAAADYHASRHGSAAGFSAASPETDATSLADGSWPRLPDADSEVGGQSRADRGVQELLGGSLSTPDSHMGDSLGSG